MQAILVIITFSLAVGFLLKKFVWDAIFESKQNASGALNGRKIKCDKNDCGCH